MKTQSKARLLEIEIDDTVYEIEFGQIQIEITGRCNMNCQHCRAAYQLRKDMAIDQIVKIIRFARQFSPNSGEIVLSGGEPLIHQDFANVLKSVRANGGECITLTTNGLLLNGRHLELIEQLSFKSFALSVSLDSLDPGKHDKFRKCPGAFVKANEALRLVAESRIPCVISSVRSTVQPSQIGEMEELVEHALKMGCKRIGFSAVHPAGRAIQRKDLWMSQDEKKRFIERIYELREKYAGIYISTNDPLKCLLSRNDENGGDEELLFNGCGAGVVTFNVDSNGTMTPCALLDLPIMNVFPLTIREMIENYRFNPIVRNLLTRNFKGKCGSCPQNYQCGGCRARAYVQKGDYLETDPHCWLTNISGG